MYHERHNPLDDPLPKAATATASVNEQGSNLCWCGGVVQHLDTPVCTESVLHDPYATGRPEKITKLYIAGPMTGYPKCNYPAFDEAEVALVAMGYEVVNPASFGSGGGHYIDLLRDDLRAMLDCHAVATLEGWWESGGARNEVHVAGLLKMPVRTAQEWIIRSDVYRNAKMDALRAAAGVTCSPHKPNPRRRAPRGDQ
jgi:hypothetical protein